MAARYVKTGFVGEIFFTFFAWVLDFLYYAILIDGMSYMLASLLQYTPLKRREDSEGFFSFFLAETAT